MHGRGVVSIDHIECAGLPAEDHIMGTHCCAAVAAPSHNNVKELIIAEAIITDRLAGLSAEDRGIAV